MADSWSCLTDPCDPAVGSGILDRAGHLPPRHGQAIENPWGPQERR